MTNGPHPRSILEDETTLRWSFLEEEPDACAVVSSRMELVYLNSRAQALTLPDWFGRRCFEVFPAYDERCAWNCPTITAVQKTDEIVFSEETLRLQAESSPVRLGVAVIPLQEVLVSRAQAVLVLRPRGDSDEAGFRTMLRVDAESLRKRIASHLGSSSGSGTR
jgi:hypothetical protein